MCFLIFRIKNKVAVIILVLKITLYFNKIKYPKNYTIQNHSSQKILSSNNIILNALF